MQWRKTADAGLEVPTTAVHIREDDDTDPKVLAFLTRKPWYARTENGAVEDAEGDANDGESGPPEWIDEKESTSI